MSDLFNYAIAMFLLFSTLVVQACEDINRRLGHNAGAAFVVAADRKIYKIDIAKGALVQTSSRIEGLGRPSDIAIHPGDQHLFISSERDLQLKSNVGIVEVLPFEPFTIVKTLLSEPDPAALKENVKTNSKLNTAITVFWLNFSPDGSRLYVSDIINQDKGFITILDPSNGKTLGWTNFLLREDYLVSADGKQVAAIWPSGSRSQMNNGKETTKQWNGGIAVGEIEKGVWLPTKKLTDNKGLQPPWSKLTSPFIYLNTSNRHLLTYHRDSGQLISEIDVQQLTQCDPAQTYPTLLENPSHIALAMACSQEEGAVVVIDVIEQKLIHKIKVGPFPTNVVVAK